MYRYTFLAILAATQVNFGAALPSSLSPRDVQASSCSIEEFDVEIKQGFPFLSPVPQKAKLRKKAPSANTVSLPLDSSCGIEAWIKFAKNEAKVLLSGKSPSGGQFTTSQASEMNTQAMEMKRKIKTQEDLKAEQQEAVNSLQKLIGSIKAARSTNDNARPAHHSTTFAQLESRSRKKKNKKQSPLPTSVELQKPSTWTSTVAKAWNNFKSASGFTKYKISVPWAFTWSYATLTAVTTVYEIRGKTNPTPTLLLNWINALAVGQEAAINTISHLGPDKLEELENSFQVLGRVVLEIAHDVQMDPSKSKNLAALQALVVMVGDGAPKSSPQASAEYLPRIQSFDSLSMSSQNPDPDPNPPPPKGGKGKQLATDSGSTSKPGKGKTPEPKSNPASKFGKGDDEDSPV